MTVVYPDRKFPGEYGRLLRSLERVGARIGTMDLLISTSAVVAEAPLATANLDHFPRLSELKVLGY